jgi:hypothetical protein
MMAERSFLLVARVAALLFWRSEVKGKSSVRGRLTVVRKVSTTFGGFFTGLSTHSVLPCPKGQKYLNSLRCP